MKQLCHDETLEDRSIHDFFLNIKKREENRE